jgi:hypothetical protein
MQTGNGCSLTNVLLNLMLGSSITIHCKKKVCYFPVPSRDVTDETLSLDGNNLIIPAHGEFGQ